MAVKGATKKQNRQYEHIKKSAKRRGTSTKRAKEIAARTVNKQKSKSGGGSKSRRGKSATSGARRKAGGATGRRTPSRSSSRRSR